MAGILITGLVAAGAGLAACLGVAAYIPIARRQGWVAAPLARSSHRLPTPVGAGIVFAMVVVLSVAILVAQGLLAPAWRVWAGVAGLFALLGWVDDRMQLPVLWRLPVQLLLCLAWALYESRAGMPGWWAWALLVLAVVAQAWFINLFNFMDGLDGFAGMEACFVLASFIALAGWTTDTALVSLLLFSGVAGFLAWNLPPARVFMGDGGSLFLGFALSALPWLDQGRCLPLWLVLVAVFVVDASLTLCWRWRRGDRVAQAHRLHVYQRLAREGGRHGPVLAGLMAVNLLWVLPWAVLVAREPRWAVPGVLVSYAGLAAGWWWLHRRLPVG